MCLRALDSPEPLERYLTLLAEMKRLQAELEALKPMITYALMEEPEQRAVYLGHELTLGTRKTWEYSDQVKAMQRDLKEAKRREVHDGVAVCTAHKSFPVVKRLTKPQAGSLT